MKTVLIAEDNPVNRELLRELLEMRGYAVVEACNGQEAMEELHKAQPDILLLDLNMPVLDGFGTIEKIRKHPAFSTLPVLAVTAYAMRGDREKILSAGFDGYLSKPIDPTVLHQELQRLLIKGTHTQAPGAQADAAGQGS
jgi:CheY-like chemotaxis protein